MRNNKKKSYISMIMALMIMIGSTAALSAGNDNLSPAGNVSLSATQSVPSLDEQAIANLQFMREEEKLARDVYLTLADLWNQRVFATIASSEQRHMDSMAALLVRFEIEDPVKDHEIGVFTNPLFTALYDDLVEQGSTSLADAFLVGITIEELDIEDIRNQTTYLQDSSIVRVYDNLLRGSLNHLATFERQLYSPSTSI